MSTNRQTKLQTVYSGKLMIKYGPTRFPRKKFLDIYMKTGNENLDSVSEMYKLTYSAVKNELVKKLEDRYMKKINSFVLMKVKREEGTVDTGLGMVIDIDAYLKGKHGV